MKNLTLFISAAIIFGLLNGAIYQKNKIKQDGQIILFKIEPIDPRSLMQGNYMAFQYAIEKDIKKIDEQQLRQHTLAIIQPDENDVAQFVGLYNGENLGPNQKLIKYRYRPYNRQKIRIQPHSFFFQENLQSLYQKGVYAIFLYRGFKDYLLVGLADNERKPILAKE